MAAVNMYRKFDEVFLEICSFGEMRENREIDKL